MSVMGETLLQMLQTLKSYSFAIKKKPLATLIKEKKEQSQIHINKQSGKYQIREKKRWNNGEKIPSS